MNGQFGMACKWEWQGYEGIERYSMGRMKGDDASGLECGLSAEARIAKGRARERWIASGQRRSAEKKPDS